MILEIRNHHDENFVGDTATKQDTNKYISCSCPHPEQSQMKTHGMSKVDKPPLDTKELIQGRCFAKPAINMMYKQFQSTFCNFSHPLPRLAKSVRRAAELENRQTRERRFVSLQNERCDAIRMDANRLDTTAQHFHLWPTIVAMQQAWMHLELRPRQFRQRAAAPECSCACCSVESQQCQDEAAIKKRLFPRISAVA